MSNQKFQITMPIPEQAVTNDGQTKPSEDLSSTIKLSLDCAMTDGHVTSPTEETSISDTEQNTVQPDLNKLEAIPVGKIFELIQAARVIQNDIDLAAEQEGRAAGTKQLNEQFREQPERKISFDDLASQVQGLGISREALAKALEPLPAEKRNTNLMDLALSLGLPADASRDAVLLENKLRAFVESTKSELPKMIERLQDPHGDDSKKLGESIILFHHADMSLLFKRAKGIEKLKLALVASNPCGWIFGLGVVLGSGHIYSLQRMVRHFDRGAPISPALRELKSEAEKHGGVIKFKSADPKSLLKGLSEVFWPNRIDIILELKKRNPE